MFIIAVKKIAINWDKTGSKERVISIKAKIDIPNKRVPNWRKIYFTNFLTKSFLFRNVQKKFKKYPETAPDKNPLTDARKGFKLRLIKIKTTEILRMLLNVPEIMNFIILLRDIY